MYVSLVDWDAICDVSRDPIIEIHGFPNDPDSGYPPEDTERLFNVSAGGRVIDRKGNSFLVLGPGSVQGSVAVRDDLRHDYQAVGDVSVRFDSELEFYARRRSDGKLVREGMDVRETIDLLNGHPNPERLIVDMADNPREITFEGYSIGNRI